MTARSAGQRREQQELSFFAGGNENLRVPDKGSLAVSNTKHTPAVGLGNSTP